jgi:2-polyprenyl-6-methoxyphenol hydroxylase-like FAD-dependent oxidoreductase
MARILIVGASLGGLLAANMLLRDGHDVQVVEKAQGSLDGRGAGIVTHAALSVALARAGADMKQALGVQVSARVALDAKGVEVARLHMPQVLTSWSRLYALLSQAFPAERVHTGAAAKHVTPSAGGVSLELENGHSLQGDLLIASDGVRSAVRAQWEPLAVPQYAGYVAWRGVCDESVLSAHTLTTVFDHFGFGLPAGEQLIGYPVAGSNTTTANATARGQRRWNFVWYRPAAADTLQDLLTDDDGVHHPLGIAPHRMRADHVTAARLAAQELLAPQFAEIIARTAQPFVQPIFDVASTHLAFDRVALMGDAAFVARPHVGMGVTKAAEDAMALSDSIRAFGATPAALKNYESTRLPAGLAVVQRARDLGAYLQAQVQGQANPMQRDADAVLRETAVDLGALRNGALTPHAEALTL